MAGFIARPDDAQDFTEIPLLETTDSHLNLRARSDLREVVRAEGRIVTLEPSRLHERFELEGPHGLRALAIQTFASGGPFQDRFDIVFDWVDRVSSGDAFVLRRADGQVAFHVFNDQYE